VRFVPVVSKLACFPEGAFLTRGRIGEGLVLEAPEGAQRGTCLVSPDGAWLDCAEFLDPHGEDEARVLRVCAGAAEVSVERRGREYARDGGGDTIMKTRAKGTRARQALCCARMIGNASCGGTVGTGTSPSVQ
jgi:hypothetical protein